ncbi:MAG TPA: hypothetical protein VMH35_27590 [Streptosporangiaceae bacterium]|nr:hypothetical protein [Streptosporangiaceae bacterium]
MDHSTSDDPHADYWSAVEAEDRRLDERLSSIRSRQSNREIDTRQAAAERIEGMEAHLAAVRGLRKLHLGEGQLAAH